MDLSKLGPVLVDLYLRMYCSIVSLPPLTLLAEILLLRRRPLSACHRS